MIIRFEKILFNLALLIVVSAALNLDPVYVLLGLLIGLLDNLWERFLSNTKLTKKITDKFI